MTRAELHRMPERPWLKSDAGARIIGFCRFRDYYGGYLVYEFQGTRYKQYIGSSMARKLGARTIDVYGQNGHNGDNGNKPQPQEAEARFPAREDVKREINGAVMDSPLIRKIFRRHPVSI